MGDEEVSCEIGATGRTAASCSTALCVISSPPRRRLLIILKLLLITVHCSPFLFCPCAGGLGAWPIAGLGQDEWRLTLCLFPREPSNCCATTISYASKGWPRYVFVSMAESLARRSGRLQAALDSLWGMDVHGDGGGGASFLPSVDSTIVSRHIACVSHVLGTCEVLFIKINVTRDLLHLEADVSAFPVNRYEKNLAQRTRALAGAKMPHVLPGETTLYVLDKGALCSGSSCLISPFSRFII